MVESEVLELLVVQTLHHVGHVLLDVNTIWTLLISDSGLPWSLPYHSVGESNDMGIMHSDLMRLIYEEQGF